MRASTMHPIDSLDGYPDGPSARPRSSLALMAGLFTALLPTAACGSKDSPPAASAPLAWKPIAKFGLQASVPADATVKDGRADVHITSGAFKMNVFAIDEYSLHSGAEARASLQREPGFEGFTREVAGTDEWRFVYALAPGDGQPRAGVSMRVVVAGTPWDCGVHGVAPEIVAQVAAACATLKPQ